MQVFLIISRFFPLFHESCKVHDDLFDEFHFLYAILKGIKSINFPMTYPIEGTATTFVDDSRPMVHFAEQHAPSGFLRISRFSLCYRVEVR